LPHWSSAVHTQTPPWHTGVLVPVQTAHEGPQWAASVAVQGWQPLPSQNDPEGHDASVQTHCAPSQPGVVPEQGWQAAPHFVGVLQGWQAPWMHS
jgi:hypothetical protein